MSPEKVVYEAPPDRAPRLLACELHVGARTHRGIAIELPASGIFVQTDATIAPLTELEVRIAGAGAVPALRLRAIVSRRLSAHN